MDKIVQTTNTMKALLGVTFIPPLTYYSELSDLTEDVVIWDMSGEDWKKISNDVTITITKVTDPEHMRGLIINDRYYLSVGAYHIILERESNPDYGKKRS